MSELRGPELPQKRGGIPLDVYAVALALVLALLVRFNLLPAIPW